MPIAGTITVLLRGDLQGFENDLKRAEARLSRTGSRLQSIGTRLSVGLTAALLIASGAALHSSIQFEQAMAGVAKTVDAPQSKLDELAQGFTDLSEEIPVARRELAGIAEEAGQLGVAFENIPGFTRVVADLRVATNLGENAGTTLARMANIMGDASPEFQRMGSVIVDLGNNSATTEREIAQMGLRIAGAGKVIGLHHPEVLALAAGLSSVGIEAQAGGTAISRVMVEIANAVASGGEKLDRFAQVAGVSAAEFKESFQKDAAGAVISFTEGLGRLNDAGVNVFAILEDVEFQNVRIRDALLRAAGAGDLMRRSLDLGRSAWQENNALTKEAERFYATTGNQLVTLKNRVSNMAGELGESLVPTLLGVVEAGEPVLQMARAMIELFGDLPAVVQTTMVATGAFLGLLGPLALGLGLATQALGALSGMTGMAAVGLLKVQGVLSTGGLILSIRSFADAVTVAKWSLGGLASLVTPGGILLAGLGLLATLFIRNKFAAMEAENEFQALRQNILATASAMSDPDMALTAWNAASSEVSRLNTELGFAQGKLENMKRNRKVEGKSSSSTGGATELEIREQKELVDAAREQLRIEQAKEEAYQNQFNLLQQQRGALRTLQGDTGSPTLPDFSRLDGVADAHRELATAIRTAEGMERLLGERYDENSAKASAYRSAIEQLLEEGVDPASPKIQAYAAKLLEAETAMDDLAEATRRRSRLEQESQAILGRSLTPLQAYEAQVRTLSAALEEGLISQDQYRAAIKQLDSELAKATDGLKDSLSEQGYQAGEALVRGIIFGTQDMGDLLKRVMINLALAYVSGPLKLALGIASPSKVFYGHGIAVGEGLALGIESMESRVAAAMDSFAIAPPAMAFAGAGIPAPTAKAQAFGGRAEETGRAGSSADSGGRATPLFQVNVPKAQDPLTLARDQQWLRALAESSDALKGQGHKF